MGEKTMEKLREDLRSILSANNAGTTTTNPGASTWYWDYYRFTYPYYPACTQVHDVLGGDEELLLLAVRKSSTMMNKVMKFVLAELLKELAKNK